MASLVLGAETVDGCLGIVVRHELSHTENGEHRSFPGNVQPRGHFGEIPREIDAADKEMWWGRKSDARFMGEYKWPRALVDEALTFCETQEGEILPSMLQPWGFQHDRYRSVAGDAMR